MALDRLILALQEVSTPGDLPGECDLGLVLKEFFERPSVQELMVKMNQTQLYDMMENRYGYHIDTYKDKTMKHKLKVGLPTPYYSYYETGKTHESLEVVATEEWVGVFPGRDAPEYATYALDESAWGLNKGHWEELEPSIVKATQDGIRKFLERKMGELKNG